MFRRLLALLGLGKKETEPPSNKSSQLNRLQRQSAMTAVSVEQLRAQRRGQAPR